jgi:DNA mismatch repair protein MutS
MTNTHDLQIEKEILPLFDYTRNSFAREALLQWLNEDLADVSDIIHRQQIIKGILINDNNILPASYSKLDLQETYSFLNSVDSNELFSKSSLELRGHFLLFTTEKHKIRSRLSQCILLLNTVNRCYFTNLLVNEFPEDFKKLIQEIKAFLLNFNLSKYESIIREGSFNTNHIIDVIHILQSKISSYTITVFWKHLFLFEAYVSIARGHKKYNLQFPVFSNEKFSITGFYHPVLKSPVKNSITKTHNVLILSGPNMAGKSTLLKTIGLCVYLAHTGCGVPADACEMPFFDTISVAINPKDDLKSGYSHFLSEIKTLKNVVSDASHKRCFAVFDELFRGTNLEDALEILKTTIRGLVKFTDSLFIISTHLHQIKDFINHQTVSTYYIECFSDNDRPVFTYQLKEGWSDVKLGRLLFEQEGLNQLLANNEYK